MIADYTKQSLIFNCYNLFVQINRICYNNLDICLSANTDPIFYEKIYRPVKGPFY